MWFLRILRNFGGEQLYDDGATLGCLRVDVFKTPPTVKTKATGIGRVEVYLTRHPLPSIVRSFRKNRVIEDATKAKATRAFHKNDPIDIEVI